MDFFITRLVAQGPSTTCVESNKGDLLCYKRFVSELLPWKQLSYELHFSPVISQTNRVETHPTHMRVDGRKIQFACKLPPHTAEQEGFVNPSCWGVA